MTTVLVRFNGHRSKFKMKGKYGTKSTSEQDTAYTESALVSALHCHDHHPDQLDLTIFRVGVVMEFGDSRELGEEESKASQNTAQTLLD